MQRTHLIGLTGSRRSGKDTVASRIQEYISNHPEGNLVVRVAFADKIKESSLAIDPWIVTTEGPRRLADLVDLYGWEHCKDDYPGVREFLQRFGTDAVRKIIGAETWIDLTKADIEDCLANGWTVVVTDVRFQNEIHLIRELGGEIWEIQRDTGLPVDRHVSEQEWRTISPDRVITNDGTLQDLYQQVIYNL